MYTASPYLPVQPVKSEAKCLTLFYYTFFQFVITVQCKTNVFVTQKLSKSRRITADRSDYFHYNYIIYKKLEGS